MNSVRVRNAGLPLTTTALRTPVMPATTAKRIKQYFAQLGRGYSTSIRARTDTIAKTTHIAAIPIDSVLYM